MSERTPGTIRPKTLPFAMFVKPCVGIGDVSRFNKHVFAVFQHRPSAVHRIYGPNSIRVAHPAPRQASQLK